jgi:hypothetical protein
MKKKDSTLDLGDYIVDLTTMSGINKVANRQNGSYVAIRKKDKKKFVIKASFDYVSNPLKEKITNRLKMLRGKVISGHLPLVDYRWGPSNELMLIFELLAKQSSLKSHIAQKGVPICEIYSTKEIVGFLVSIADGLLHYKKNFSAVHNELQMRRLITYQVPGNESKTFITLNFPNRLVVTGDINYDFTTDDVEYLSINALLGYKAKNLVEREKECVWSFGILMYELFAGERPYTLGEAEIWAAKAGKADYSKPKKLALLIKDKKFDWPSAKNPIIAKIVRNVLSLDPAQRLSLPQLQNLMVGYYNQ